jgi:hypothetical protein
MINGQATARLVSAFSSGAVVGLVLYGVGYYLVYVKFGIPFSLLIYPYAINVLATGLAALFFRIARERYVASCGRDPRLGFWTIGCYCFVVVWSWTFWGTRLGVIRLMQPGLWYGVLVVSSILGPLAGYYVVKNLKSKFL